MKKESPLFSGAGRNAKQYAADTIAKQFDHHLTCELTMEVVNTLKEHFSDDVLLATLSAPGHVWQTSEHMPLQLCRCMEECWKTHRYNKHTEICYLNAIA